MKRRISGYHMLLILLALTALLGAALIAYGAMHHQPVTLGAPWSAAQGAPL